MTLGVNSSKQDMAVAPPSGVSTMIDRRFKRIAAVNSATSAANADEVDLRNFAGGLVKAPADLDSNTTVTYFAHTEHDDSDPTALYDVDNAAVTQTLTADSCFPLPDELFAAASFRMVTDNSAIEFEVHLKG